MLDHLRTRPAEALSIDGIAKRAGVARSTVYEIFGSRTGLFDAAARDVYDRTGYEELLVATSQEDALEHLRGGITAATRMQARERDVYRALYSMHYLDPDSVGGVVAGIDAERTEGMRRLARRLHEQGYLADGMSQAVAAHVLWVLTSFESFDALYTGRGLSVARSAALIVEMAERAVTNARA